MSRAGLTSTNATAAKAAVVYPRFYAEFDFSGGWFRVWSGVGNVTIAALSRTFGGVGTFGGFEEIRESGDIAAQGLAFTLSGIPSALVATVLGENYRGRPCTMWVGFVNSGGTLLDTPLELYSGFMDRITIEDTGATSTIRLDTENHLAELRKPRVVRWTHEEQQRLYPGDMALEYLAKIWERPIVWGVVNKRTEAVAPAAVPGAAVLRARGM
jgi:hypothetical protein